MNGNVRNAIVQIENENLKNLVKEVKETLATNLNTDAPACGQKSFGIVDLWNRQRNTRTATLLRKY